MYRVLAIGNSFSEDATYYLHDILDSAGIENEVINLYIGGCPLERHWQNIELKKAEYQYQKNGRKTDRYVSIQEVLREGNFDAIVTHQASGDSGWENTYEPFLGCILEFLRKETDAKIYLNETWAYEKGSTHGHFMRYQRNQEEMFARLGKAYKTAAVRHELPLIPTGEVIQKLREASYFSETGHCITRDSFHLSFLYGRYAAALTWASKLTGINVMDNLFVPVVDFLPVGKADPAVIEMVKRTVLEIIS